MTKITLSTEEQLRRRAALVQQGGARAAVLGVNDGLVSTLCLVVGVAAAGASTQAVLTAGFAGLLAGAISMSAGEWISVRSQVELFEGVLADLSLAMKDNKKELVRSLAKGLVAHGVTEKAAKLTAEGAAKDDEKFKAIYAAQVVGINQDELGSPRQTAISSFVLFAAGSIIPLAPWLFLEGKAGIISSVAMTLVAGLFAGAYVARSSGRPIWNGALRQLLIIIGASLATYVIGYLFGVTIG